MIGDLVPDLLRGLLATLEITVLSFVGAVGSGTLIAVFRVGPVTPLRWVGAVWVGAFRNLPALVLLVLWVFGLPEVGVRFGLFTSACVCRLLPALITEVVAILIYTTLGYAVSYTELLHNAQTVGQLYQVPVQAYLVVAAIYVVVNGLLSQVATRVQRRQGLVTPGAHAATATAAAAIVGVAR